MYYIGGNAIDYKEIALKTNKSVSTIKKWRLRIEMLSGYKFKKVRRRVSKRSTQVFFDFTEVEVTKFIVLSHLVDKTKNLDDSIKEVWGDSKAQSERDIKNELKMLSEDFYKFLFEAEDSMFQLKKNNQSLQKQVKELTERLNILENEKDSGIFNKLKRGF
ncbi:hypothetical protein ACR9F9_01115 [Streptococcus dysgalactiae subsp. equisimilis]|uniref:hypothetical protein n=1 Tax=Streptococcus dysgalactiae TaxID=1334 RepID=UPI003FD7AA76